MKRALLLSAVALMSVSAAACATAPTTPVQNAVAASAMPTTQSIPYTRGSAPFTIPSMIEPGFQCLKQDFDLASQPVRIAVSNIPDRTGKISYEAAQGGTIVSQGASDMMISALGKIQSDNLWVVERFDTAIMNTEIEMGKQQLLGSGPGEYVSVVRGQYLPSDYYIAGSITNVSGNIQSGGAVVEVNGIGLSNRKFVVAVDVDLRLVRTRDGRTVAWSQGTKQISASENRAGGFAFGGDYLFNIEFGSKNQEAIGLGVRTILEYATLELLPAAIQSTQPKRCLDYTNQLLASHAS